MELVRVSVRAESDSVSLVQDIIRYYARIHGISEDEVERFLIPVEEAMAQVIEYGFPGNPDAMFDVSVSIEGLDLKVTIIDKGIPYDYEMLENSLGADLSVRLLKGFADGLSLTSIGSGGRKQVLMKHLAALPEYTRHREELLKAEPAPVSPDTPLDFHMLRREEAIEVAQCIYDEFGYTYLHEIVYYPEEFYKSVQRGECVSMVVTDTSGEVVGHLALVGTSAFRGTMELCMAVVKKKYRNCKIMNRLTEKLMGHARTLGLASVNAMPVIYHVYTQKSANRQGMHPSGFMFNITNDDMATSFDEATRASGALAVFSFNDTHREVFIRPSVEAIARYVVNEAEADRNINVITEDFTADGESAITVEADPRGESGRIMVNRTGSDVAVRLKAADNYLRSQNCKVVMMYISTSEKSSVLAYDAAAGLGYYCTGLYTACSDTDYLMMENIMFSNVDYDKIQTIEPFTGLLELVKEGDPHA